MAWTWGCVYVCACFDLKHNDNWVGLLWKLTTDPVLTRQESVWNPDPPPALHTDNHPTQMCSKASAVTDHRCVYAVMKHFIRQNAASQSFHIFGRRLSSDSMTNPWLGLKWFTNKCVIFFFFTAHQKHFDFQTIVSDKTRTVLAGFLPVSWSGVWSGDIFGFQLTFTNQTHTYRRLHPITNVNIHKLCWQIRRTHICNNSATKVLSGRDCDGRLMYWGKVVKGIPVA